MKSFQVDVLDVLESIHDRAGHSNRSITGGERRFCCWLWPTALGYCHQQIVLWTLEMVGSQ